MAIAYDARHLPLPASVLPDYQEFRAAFAFTARNLAEAMLAFFDRAVVLDRIHFERGLQQFPAHLQVTEGAPSSIRPVSCVTG